MMMQQKQFDSQSMGSKTDLSVDPVWTLWVTRDESLKIRLFEYLLNFKLVKFINKYQIVYFNLHAKAWL